MICHNASHSDLLASKASVPREPINFDAVFVQFAIDEETRFELGVQRVRASLTVRSFRDVNVASADEWISTLISA